MPCARCCVSVNHLISSSQHYHEGNSNLMLYFTGEETEVSELRKLPSRAQLCHGYTKSLSGKQSTVHHARQLQKAQDPAIS